MYLLPIENITFKTKLNNEEVFNRLYDFIEPKKPFSLESFGDINSNKPYQGELNRNSFKIKRIIKHRNSFLPRIKGFIKQDNNGSIINTKFRLSVYSKIVLLLFFSFVGLVCILVLTVPPSYSSSDFASLIPFGMILFAYIMTMWGFLVESKRAKKDLKKLLEAEIIK